MLSSAVEVEELLFKYPVLCKLVLKYRACKIKIKKKKQQNKKRRPLSYVEDEGRYGCESLHVDH